MASASFTVKTGLKKNCAAWVAALLTQTSRKLNYRLPDKNAASQAVTWAPSFAGRGLPELVSLGLFSPFKFFELLEKADSLLIFEFTEPLEFPSICGLRRVHRQGRDGTVLNLAAGLVLPA